MTYLIQASYTRIDKAERIDRWAITATKRQQAIETLEEVLRGFTADGKVTIISAQVVAPIQLIESLPL